MSDSVKNNVHLFIKLPHGDDVEIDVVGDTLIGNFTAHVIKHLPVEHRDVSRSFCVLISEPCFHSKCQTHGFCCFSLQTTDANSLFSIQNARLHRIRSCARRRTRRRLCALHCIHPNRY